MSEQTTGPLIFPAKQFHAILQGHVLDIIAKLPSDFIDTIITSPPYWGLRDYRLPPTVWDGNGKCEHVRNEVIKPPTHGEGFGDEKGIHTQQEPTSSDFCSKCSAWKGQLGLEPDFRLYVRHMLQVTKELKRVLKPTGSLWLNLGDTYNSSGAGNKEWAKGTDGLFQRLGKQNTNGEMRNPTPKTIQRLPTKSLCFIPQRIALGMIDEQNWILRNQVVWFKPNGMPSSVRDRFSNRWEPVFFFTKEPRYWFDLDAVRERWTDNRPADIRRAENKHPGYEGKFGEITAQGIKGQPVGNPILGKNPGDVMQDPTDFWEITTQPHPFAHFAVYPDALVERPVKASCPEWICVSCGKARERITKPTEQYAKLLGKSWHDHSADEEHGMNETPDKQVGTTAQYQTVGWTTCSCKNQTYESSQSYRPGIVLDPFAGSGTTGVVAKSLGRSSIQIELNPDYIKIIKQRLDWGHETVDGSVEWVEA